MNLTENEQRKLHKLKFNLPFFASNCLKITTKDARIVPFVLNRSQEYFHAICEEEVQKRGRLRVLVVKGRQSGISTYVAARFYHKTSMRRAIKTFILSHESQTTAKLFHIVKLYNEKNPFAPQVKRSNSNELLFEELNSQYYVGTAGSGDVGRGGTVQLFHGSEVAMWKNTDDIETGLMESIPEMDGTEIILESTAKGLGNFFHRMVVDALKGKTRYRVAFLPWFWMDEYEEKTDDFEPDENDIEYALTYLKEYPVERQHRKLAWRRMKIAQYGGEWKFKQEYPSNVTEAFQTSSNALINSERIMKARTRESFVSNQAPLIIGVDPARSGDRTVIVFRRGREIERIIKYDDMDEMRLANILAGFIDKYEPITVNIDCTNSWGTHDRLKEKGYRNVRGIHFGQKATEDKLYANIRAEMWCLLRDWFDEDVKIPDDDELHTDLTSVPEYEETDGKIRLVKKEKIKQELGFSPDIGDAAALTFGVKISQSFKNIENKSPGLSTLKKFNKKDTRLVSRR